MKGEEKNQSSRKIVNLMKSRWFVPAAVLTVGAVVLTVVIATQGKEIAKQVGSLTQTGQEIVDDLTGESVPTMQQDEIVKLPFNATAGVKIARGYYDVNASSEDQEKSLVLYNNTYTENKGIDYVAKDNKSFDVTAAVSGTVVSVYQDGLLGNVVLIESKENVQTMYSALSEVSVEKGMKVVQGQLIGVSGTNVINKELGNHLHFELIQGTTYVNPVLAFDKPFTAIANLVKDEMSAKPVGGDVKKPETTVKTDATKKPEGTTKPDATKKPEGETKPDATKKPEGETKPDATKKPEGTTNPDATKKPDASKNDAQKGNE